MKTTLFGLALFLTTLPALANSTTFCSCALVKRGIDRVTGDAVAVVDLELLKSNGTFIRTLSTHYGRDESGEVSLAMDEARVACAAAERSNPSCK